MKREEITVVEEKKVEILTKEVNTEELGSTMIGGKTLYSLISVGTEIMGFYLHGFEYPYPMVSGYAAVFQVDRVGSDVVGIQPGDIVFSRGSHVSYQLHDYREVVKIPEGVDPDKALFARMANVSMRSLKCVNSNPGAKALIVGLGLVGTMALQAYYNCGYQVVGVERNPERAKTVKELTGFEVYTELPEELNGTFSLALECSGYQQGIDTCLDALRIGGELCIIGIPWKKTSDQSAFDMVGKIVYKWLDVYSGWESDLPLRERELGMWEQGAVDPFTQVSNYTLALRWLKDGVLKVDGLYDVRPYTEIAEIYDSYYHRTAKTLTTVLKW